MGIQLRNTGLATQMNYQCSVSILGCDFCNLKNNIQTYIDAGIDRIHVDVFDGQFVPNITFGKEAVKSIRDNFSLYTTCHLCVIDPFYWVEYLAKIKIDAIYVQWDSCHLDSHRKELYQICKSHGISFGFGLAEEVEPEVLQTIENYFDCTLVMLTEAGGGGFKQNPRNLQKIRKLKESYPEKLVIADGGIKVKNAHLCKKAGADVLVCGSEITTSSSENLKTIIQKLKEPLSEEILTDCLLKPAKHVPFMSLDKHIENELEKENIVNVNDIELLKKELTEAEKGKAIVLCLGDCSENWDNRNNFIDMMDQACNSIKSTKKIKLFRQAGQFAKPRTNYLEPNIFWGLNINSPTDTRINQQRLLTGVEYSKKLYEKMGKPYICHEALVIPLEIALTRKINGKYYNTSAHMLWLGNKTKQLDHAHVAYLKHIENPIGIKLDSTTTCEELLDLLNTLNPFDESGKIILIPRCGVNKTTCIKELVNCTRDRNVSWVVDPMHGNTVLENGHKIRYLDDIENEIKEVCWHLRSNGAILGGFMFESTPEHVNECVRKGQQTEIISTTLCDPRVTTDQLVEILDNVSLESYGNVGVILAKKGSIGLPDKNKLYLNDLPLYLETAKEMIKHYDAVVVSSNDEEILQECERNGILVVRRPDELASNSKYVESVYFTVNRILEMAEQGKCVVPKTISIAMCVRPYREKGIMTKILTLLHENDVDSVVTCSPCHTRSEWMFNNLNEHGGEIKPSFRNNKDSNVTQAREGALYEIDNAVVSFTLNSYYKSNSKLPWKYLGKKTLAIQQKFGNSNFKCDINEIDDLEWANFLQTYHSWKINRYESGMVSDLLDKMGYRNQVINQLHLNLNLKYFGRCRTVLLSDSQAGENIQKGLSFLESLDNGDVLVVQGSNEYAYFGELMTRLSETVGLAGVVIGGLTRDSTYISKLPIHSFGYTPKDIKGRGTVVAVDCPVEIRGVKIKPGDYVFGDKDGVVIIPQEIDGFFAKIEHTIMEEDDIKRKIASKLPISSILESHKEF